MTYPVLSETFDEAHFAAGIQWIGEGKYFYDPQHPPLARLALAAGPYLDGVRPRHEEDIWREANAILGSGPAYWRMLSLARVGVLPFLGLACLVLWMWTRDVAGSNAALAAVGLFTLLPPILAHSGLATLDMACAATVFAAGYAWFRWLRSPGYGIWLGIAMGVAVMTKFSALLFLPVICATVWACGRQRLTREHAASLVSAAGVAVAICLLAYRGDIDGIVHGVTDVIAHNGNGHASWLLGEFRTTGWWYFFPVVLAVKTPLAFLALVLVGVWARAWMPLAVAGALLASVMPSGINLGVRHVLVVYPFLAMTAGMGIVRIWRWHGLAGFLVGSLAASSVLAGPDYLSYFNPLAGEHPEHVLAESDMDWGQDLGRLDVELRRLGAGRVWLAYFGSANPSALLSVPWAPAPPVPVDGYVAVSVHEQTIGLAMGNGLGWLAGRTPVAMAGKSIAVYRVESPQLCVSK